MKTPRDKRSYLRYMRQLDRYAKQKGVHVKLHLYDVRGVNLMRSAIVRGRFIFADKQRLRFNNQ